MYKKKYIPTPEAMYELFEKYKEQCKANPKYENIYSHKEDKIVPIPREVPLSLSGFYVFGYENKVTLQHYFVNSLDAYDDYRTICTRIKQEIRKDQIDGGQVGIYNASITQRLNGLIDKSEIDYKREKKIEVKIIE